MAMSPSCWATATARSSLPSLSPLRAGPSIAAGLQRWRAVGSGRRERQGRLSPAGQWRRDVLVDRSGQHHPHSNPLVADVNGDGTDDVLVVDGAGDILYRQGIPGQPGSFLPPVIVNPGYPVARYRLGAQFLDRAAAGQRRRPGQRHLALFLSQRRFRPGRLADDRPASRRRSSRPTSTATAGTTWWSAMPAMERSRCSSTTSSAVSPAALRQPFLPPVTIPVGLGVSDVEAIATNADGHLNLVVTNTLTGQVSVLYNDGDDAFAAPVPYRAGTGVSAIDPSSSPEVTSLDETAGVAGGPLVPGGPTALVTINPGSNTLDVLAGLGGGRFANPVTIDTPSPAEVVRVADLDRTTASSTWPSSPPRA